ncbi:hypothetical protein DES53_11218 [Roseimicrobium gellanilyticum]|uniref:Uncharacterized protein n=1 Tax=Roseimicrobium gellanilyticum TaxID=748857 RepID=A0A366H783_9BACT|nr:hypothetical protein [Roseimicrobium gellanilyticum]RBP38020.1 hypothetical protein DES53_11218 [Roseimicrobium gellanilyticum]
MFESGHARELLNRWAQSQELTIESADLRVFLRGPFFWATAQRRVFRISVKDAHGVARRGWACCGWTFASWKTGMEEKVVVEWDF